MDLRKRILPIAALLTAGTLALTGCTSEPDGPNETGATVSSPSQSTSTEASEQPADLPEGAVEVYRSGDLLAYRTPPPEHAGIQADTYQIVNTEIEDTAITVTPMPGAGRLYDHTTEKDLDDFVLSPPFKVTDGNSGTYLTVPAGAIATDAQVFIGDTELEIGVIFDTEEGPDFRPREPRLDGEFSPEDQELLAMRVLVPAELKDELDAGEGFTRITLVDGESVEVPIEGYTEIGLGREQLEP